MGKDPAFLFYTKDFFILTATLTWEERGKLITILCIMHQQGRMDEKTISNLVGSISENLRKQFTTDKDGLWFCEWLEQRIEERSNFVSSRRENGSKGGRPTSKPPEQKLPITESKPVGSTKKNHTVDVDANEKATVKKKERSSKQHAGNEIETVILPFDSAEFIQAWQAYLQMRIEKKKPFKSKTAQQAKLRKLANTGLDETTISAMLMQSVENEWQDIYPLKNDFITKKSAIGFVGEAVGISREETIQRLNSYSDNQSGTGQNT